MEKKIRNSIGICTFIQLYHLDRQTPDIMIESIVKGVHAVYALICVYAHIHT